MSDRKPRVALLLSGLPRQWRKSLPSQMELLKDFPFDVFFHFWDVIDEAEKRDMLAALNPRAYLFEKPQDFSRADVDPAIRRDNINVPSRMFSQYYSWRGVAKLFEPFQAEYDLAMRSRSDLQFVYGIGHILPHLKPNEILMPWWDENLLLSDLFAVGGTEPILYYHKLFDVVMDYAPKGYFNPEALLIAHFEKRPDVRIIAETHQYFFVRRPHMDNYTVEQAMLENPGRNKWLDPEVVQAHAVYHRLQKGEEGEQYVKDYRHSQLVTLVKEVREKAEKDPKS